MTQVFFTAFFATLGAICAASLTVLAVAVVAAIADAFKSRGER